MKTLLTLSFLLTCASAFAMKMNLKEFDQEKLAEVIGRLPEELKSESESVIRHGRKVTSVFPLHPGAYEISCERYFYSDSPVPTDSKCVIDIDPNSNDYEAKNDQIKISEDDEVIARALFSALPLAGSFRKFYSSYYDTGTSFEGKKTNVFHYIFMCNDKVCTLWFSKKIESSP